MNDGEKWSKTFGFEIEQASAWQVLSSNLRYMQFHRSKDFEAMKTGKLAIWSWLSYQYYAAHGQAVHFIKNCKVEGA